MAGKSDKLVFDPDTNQWVPLVKTKNGYSVGHGGVEYKDSWAALDAAPQSKWIHLRDGRQFYIPELQNRATKPVTFYVGSQAGAYKSYRRPGRSTTGPVRERLDRDQ